MATSSQRPRQGIGIGSQLTTAGGGRWEQDPDRGDVIQETGGLRKLRWNKPGRGKGRSGGLRVIYLHVPEVEVILLMKVYDKSVADDLTQEQKKTLGVLVETFRREIARAN